MMISKTFMPSVLMMAISTVMVGCGGDGSGRDSSSSNSGGTENSNNGSTNPKPVTDQSLKDGLKDVEINKKKIALNPIHQKFSPTHPNPTIQQME